jgi:UDP-2-acetamido-3-amino-2,3-dideoxy-glucuronate N-acetyltransferase
VTHGELVPTLKRGYPQVARVAPMRSVATVGAIVTHQPRTGGTDAVAPTVMYMGGVVSTEQVSPQARVNVHPQERVRGTYIHPTAEVSPLAMIGEGTRIWHQAQIRERARIGRSCIIGKGVYIDFDVTIGDRVKIQNGVSIYHGANIEDGVFIGPHACLTNDKLPRAITPEGELKSDADWEVGKTLVQYGASIGAGAIILPGVTVGRFALVGAGAVVTRDVAAQALVVGNPARQLGFVCMCGQRLQRTATPRTPRQEHGAEYREHGVDAGGSRQDAPEAVDAEAGHCFSCPSCGREYTFPQEGVRSTYVA